MKAYPGRPSGVGYRPKVAPRRPGKVNYSITKSYLRKTAGQFRDAQSMTVGLNAKKKAAFYVKTAGKSLATTEGAAIVGGAVLATAGAIALRRRMKRHTGGRRTTKQIAASRRNIRRAQLASRGRRRR